MQDRLAKKDSHISMKNSRELGIRASLVQTLFLATLMSGYAIQASASLAVSPVRVNLNEGQQVATLNLRNLGVERIIVQVQFVSWTQENGENIHGNADCDFLIACPPIISIEAGGEQVVRVGLIDKIKDWSVEHAYRLFLQEVPRLSDNEDSQVQISLRMSIPVFLSPTKPVKPTLEWKIDMRENDGLWLTVSNNGNLHALIDGVRLQQGSVFNFETSAHQYVLPGSTISWRLDKANPYAGIPPEQVELTVSTDQGVYQELLLVGK